MKGRYAMLASMTCLCACAAIRRDHSDRADVPPPVKEEITWESFIMEPWRDPLQDKYAELFGKPYPNAGLQHFYTDRPFSDVKKFELEYDAAWARLYSRGRTAAKPGIK